MINIVEYDSGLGSLTSTGAIEDGENFIVRKNIALNSKNVLTYNNTHFLEHSLDSSGDDYPIDLFIGSPFFGDKIDRRGGSNFKINELNECLAYVSLKLPPHVLIVIYGSAITHLQIDSRVTETYDQIPTNDIVISKMKDLGYSVQNIVFDSSRYRLPNKKIVGLYYCWKYFEKSNPIVMPEFESVDEKCYVGNWLRSCKNSSKKFGDKDWSKSDICSKIVPGMNALRTKEISITKGYARLKPDIQIDNLGSDFYKVSGSSWCIHPYEDRPLTIEEGAFLSGLDSRFLIDTSLSKKEMASYIYRSVPPLVGYKIKMGLLNSLG